MNTPYSAPEGTSPKTWQVTITTVIPGARTDPSTWDYPDLLEHIEDHHWAEVDAVRLAPVLRSLPEPEPACHVEYRDRSDMPQETPTRAPMLEPVARSRKTTGLRTDGSIELRYVSLEYVRAGQRLSTGRVSRHQGRPCIWFTVEEADAVYQEIRARRAAGKAARAAATEGGTA